MTMTYDELPINIENEIHSPCEDCELTSLKKCSKCDYFISRQILTRILYKEARKDTCKYYYTCGWRQKGMDACEGNGDCFEKYDFDYRDTLECYGIKTRDLIPKVTIGTMDYDEYDRYYGMDSTVETHPFYTHPKGWDVLRPIDHDIAVKIRTVALLAYQNKNLVYDMEHSYEVIERGIHTEERTGCNASTLIRAILMEALKTDIPDFNTASMCKVLEDTGYFQKHFAFKSLEKTPLEVGDILVTQTKGNCVTVLKVDYE